MYEIREGAKHELKKAFQYQKQIGKLMTDIVGDDLEIIKTPVNTKTTAAANPNKFLVNKEVYKRSELNYLFLRSSKSIRMK